ncbi:nuclear transport factor 2 family protein [Undibacterium sp. TJN25]|uniref:nuclear transport factor 2 family protein n=1 Tax=Undibacterium sp. TJN25 TaxID=3413056 RepID=UPI003BF165DA
MARKKYHSLLSIMAATALLLAVAPQSFAAPQQDNAALSRKIAELDAEVFDAYNRCDMEKFESLFTPDVEFYHDNGGATFDRASVIASTRQYICNKVRRQLLGESLRIYPIKDFGAVEEGEHIFCQTENGRCEGAAKFLMIWENKEGRWRISRVVSYGHRELSETEKAQLH